MKSPLCARALWVGLLIAGHGCALRGGELPERLRVASIQMASTSDLQANCDRILRGIGEARKASAQVAVFPETALSGFDAKTISGLDWEDLERRENAIAAAAKDAGIHVIYGSATRRKEGRPFNSAVVVGPSGKEITRYHKMVPEAWFEPGDHLAFFEVAGAPCTLIICHDERYPELVRLPVLMGARVCFYVSYEVNRIEQALAKMENYRAQLIARAAENGIWVVQSNGIGAERDRPDRLSLGYSRVVDPAGRVLREAPGLEDSMITEDLILAAATRGNAMRSLEVRGLREWWQGGISQAASEIQARSSTRATAGVRSGLLIQSSREMEAARRILESGKVEEAGKIQAGRDIQRTSHSQGTVGSERTVGSQEPRESRSTREIQGTSHSQGMVVSQETVESQGTRESQSTRDTQGNSHSQETVGSERTVGSREPRESQSTRDSQTTGPSALSSPAQKHAVRLGLLKAVPIRWELEANFKVFLGLLETASREGVEVFVTPEGWLDGYASPAPDSTPEKLRSVAQDPLASPYLRRVAQEAKARSMLICFGFTSLQEGKIHNAAGLWGPDGRLIGVYHKTHLQGHDLQYSPGESLPAWDTPWGPVGVMICADRRWPETARTLRLQGARWILNPSYGMHHEANEWWMRTRGYENQCFIAFCHPKVAFIVDPKGNIAGKLESEPPGVLVREVDLTLARDDNHIRDRRPELYGPITAPRPAGH